MTAPNPELIYTLELARSLDRFVREIDASQEKVKWEPDNRGAEAAPTLAFDRAIRRGKEAIIAMLTKATRELVPLDGEEMGKFIRSLEYGEIPEGAFFQSTEKVLSADAPAPNCRRLRNGNSESQKQSLISAKGGRARGNAGAHLDRKPARASQREASHADSRSGKNGNGSSAGSLGPDCRRLKKEEQPGLLEICVKPTPPKQPAAKAGSAKSADDDSSGEVRLPSDAKSEEVMSQWR
jgi:hypothetical protein